MVETFVYIDNMRMHAYHGVMPQERTVGNDYILNIKVGYPWTNAAATDDVNDTLNYASLATLIKAEMLKPANLLEAVAGRIVNAVQVTFPDVTSISLDIKKVAPPVHHDVDGCGVVIEWKK